MSKTPQNITGENYHIMVGDALERLKELPDNSVDSIVTDPPYGLSDNKYVADTITKWIQGERDFIPDGKGFMGKAWDAFVPPPAIWDECMRVLKPGGHLLAFFGTRTQDIGALAIRLAGFEIRDSVAWLYGSGFPKSLDISKAIDKAAGAERELLGRNPNSRENATKDNTLYESGTVGKTDYITAPSTDAAKQWEGWGTALKPAHEPIVVARKPVEGTVANNVLQWGTGGLNIDASRIGNEEISTHNAPKGTFAGGEQDRGSDTDSYKTHTGRFPANFILSHTEDCVETGETVSDTFGGGAKASSGFVNGYEGDGFVASSSSTPVYRCVPGCPVAELDKQSDGSSRFFYVAKASKKDRNEGLDDIAGKEIGAKGNGLASPCQTCGASILNPCECPDRTYVNPVRQNFHPTVKPTALMEYLVRLVTPEGGTVLDPFTGSGSTGKAALLNGFKFIGCELTEDYLDIIRGRLEFAEAALKDPSLRAPSKPAGKPAQTMPSKATGGSLTALDAAEVALQRAAAKKGSEWNTPLSLFDEENPAK